MKFLRTLAKITNLEGAKWSYLTGVEKAVVVLAVGVFATTVSAATIDTVENTKGGMELRDKSLVALSSNLETDHFSEAPIKDLRYPASEKVISNSGRSLYLARVSKLPSHVLKDGFGRDLLDIDGIVHFTEKRTHELFVACMSDGDRVKPYFANIQLEKVFAGEVISDELIDIDIATKGGQSMQGMCERIVKAA